ncbi:protein kinase [Streptomyces sp. NPDC015220]|uniref:serine/threonine-protein kinase n=1 Tax=Streptomyces sp. NPDC015220 TaxID=3364947 RepID=UPI003700CC99
MGEVFAGRYELADPIGRGGVGAVWRAWDHRRRRYVAAKVLQQRDAHSLLRFVREQALRIDHPHVLAPASWAADDDQVLFTMDLVAGGSLVHLVGDYGPLPPVLVCTLLDQLLSGLAAVHAEGVVHRDVKPANVLLEATGTGRPRLRLSDFGIAMRLGEPRLTATDLVVGTPGYLSPEQMMGAEPDFPADLFATGLVALYLLQGAKPDAKALVEYFAERGTPGAPQGVPEPLWQVVATLLQPDPQARFRTATGARKALASAVELLPEPGPEDELIEIFDQLGALPPGFGPDGPLGRSPGVTTGAARVRRAAGASQETAGPSQETAGPSQETLGPSQETLGPSQEAAGASQGAAGPSQYVGELSGTTSGAGWAARTAAGLQEAADDPPAAARPGSGAGTPDGAGPHDGTGAPGRTGHSGQIGDSGRTNASSGSSASGPFAPAPPATGVPAPASGARTPPTGARTPPTGAPATAAGPGFPPPPAGTGPPVSGPRPDLRRGTGPTAAPDRDGSPSTPSEPGMPPTPPGTGDFRLPAPWPGVAPARDATPSTAVPSGPTVPAVPAVPYEHPHAPHPSGHPDPRHPAGPATRVLRQRAEAATASYTAEDFWTPVPARAVSRHRAVRARRPGPPAKAVVPLLLLALACYVVGFWALSRL